MKYKNRLIVPTIVSLSLFGLSLNVNADEINKEKEREHQEKIYNDLDYITYEIEPASAEQRTRTKEESVEAVEEIPSNEEVPEQIVEKEKTVPEPELKNEPLEENIPEKTMKGVYESENEKETGDDSELGPPVEDTLSKTPLEDEIQEELSSNTEVPEEHSEENAVEVPQADEEPDVIEKEEIKEDSLPDGTPAEIPEEKISKEPDLAEVYKVIDEKESTVKIETVKKVKGSKNEVSATVKKSTEEEVSKEESDMEEEKLSIQTFSALSPILMKADQESTTPVYSNISLAAKIASVDNSGLRSPVTSTKSVSANFLLDKTIFIERQADYAGEKFYRVHSSYDGAMQGWMKKHDLKLWNLSEETINPQKYILSKNNGGLLTDPWGTQNQYVKPLNSYNNNETFQAEKSVKLGALTFHYGKIGNDYGWIQDTKVKEVAADPIYSSASYAAKIISAKNSGLYSPVTSKKGVNADFLLDKTIFVEREASYGGETFYRVHSSYQGAMQGWMKKHDLKLWNLSEETINLQKYNLSKNNGGLLTDPWGTKEQYIKPLSSYNNNETFQAERSVKLGALTFHYGKIGNNYGWIQDTKLTPKESVAPSPEVTTLQYDKSLDEVLDIQMNLRAKPQAWVSGGGWRDATRSEVEQYLNPANHTTDIWDYTYLDLNRAQNISSMELNSKLLSGKGILDNQGTASLQAANAHGVNEVYLISHALHETGNGTSQLAQGVRLDDDGNISENGTLYYNMYGIAAYDHAPVLEGARHAQRMGWDTPSKAVIGGAQFISSGYFNRGQNTLYAMRWNPARPGTYQYATDVNWAYATARNLKNYYDQLGLQGQYYTRYTF